MREKLYKSAIALSIIFVFDGLFMALSLLQGGYSGGPYVIYILIPLFIPAALASMIISGIYVYGFARLSWRPRRFEWLFFFLFVVSVAIKVIGQTLFG